MLACTVARADTVTLRNGKTMEGVIASESAEELVLAIGMGSVTLKRSAIASVTRSDTQANQSMQSAWQTQYIRVRDLPEDLRTLAGHMDRLRVRRETGLRAAKDLPHTLRRADQLQQQRTRRQGEYQRVAADLAAMDQRRNIRAYNFKVQENNQLIADVNRLGEEIKAAVTSADRLRGQVSAYSRELTLFEAAFEPFRGAYSVQPEGGGHIPAAWLDQTRAELERYQADFERMAIPLAAGEGHGTLVDVSINGRAPVAMILDTGASLVTLSQTLARRLGIRLDHERTLSLQLADGSRIEGYAVDLETVAVGDARVQQVPAVVIDAAPTDNAEGLLGMSFLEHFQMHFNAAQSQLELQRIPPP
jgi:aspartyl protease family protein